jgi:hypothetical protein
MFRRDKAPPPPLRPDLERSLAQLHEKDAGRLRKSAYAEALGRLHAHEHVVAVLPILIEPTERGPLVLSDERLVFLGEHSGDIDFALTSIESWRIDGEPQLFVKAGPGHAQAFDITVARPESRERFLVELDSLLAGLRSS